MNQSSNRAESKTIRNNIIETQLENGYARASKFSTGSIFLTGFRLTLVELSSVRLELLHCAAMRYHFLLSYLDHLLNPGHLLADKLT